MTELKKKIASILVASALLCPMCIASVSAANTTDIKWYAACNSSDYTFADLSRLKEDSSPVFFKMTFSQTSSTVRVKVLGASNTTHNWDLVHNLTTKGGQLKNYALCSKNKNYSIHNTVYEDNYSFVSIAVKTGQDENIAGYWSADSSGTWNEATYY